MVRIESLVMALLTVTLAAACGAEDEVELIRDDLPAVPEGAARLVTPPFTVDPGVEIFMCMRVPFDVTEDMYVQRSTSYQMTGGHHVLLYYTTSSAPVQDAPHECDESDMGDIRLIAVGTAYGVGIGMPDGVALKVPKGARIYIQSHYLNATDDALLAQDVVDLELLPLNEVENLAGTFVQVDLSLDLPPDEETTRVIECAPPLQMTVPWLMPHMHELGAQFTLELLRGDETLTLYESAWDPSKRDHAPLVEHDPHLVIETTDRLRTTCTWDNDSGVRKLFPAEMCATFMPFYPSPDGAFLACDENENHFRL